MSRVIYHYNNNNEKEHIHVTPEEKANCKKCCCKKLPTLKRKSEYKKANLLKPVYTSGDGTDFSLGHPDYEYKYGCLDFNNDCKAWMQPDGSWGYSNSGLICTNESGKGESLVVDTLFDLNLTAKMLNGYSEFTTKKPIKTLVNTHSNGDHTFGNELVANLGADIISTRACFEEMSHDGGSAGIENLKKKFKTISRVCTFYFLTYIYSTIYIYILSFLTDFSFICYVP